MVRKLFIMLIGPIAVLSLLFQFGLFVKTEAEVKLASAPTATPTPTMTPESFAQEVYGLVNEYRVQNNLSVLTESVATCSITNARLVEVNNDYSHKGFYKFSPAYNMSLGENIASNYIRPQDVVEGWIASPLHKENLDKPWTHMCIATDGVYVVQIFSF